MLSKITELLKNLKIKWRFLNDAKREREQAMARLRRNIKDFKENGGKK